MARYLTHLWINYKYFFHCFCLISFNISLLNRKFHMSEPSMLFHILGKLSHIFSSGWLEVFYYLKDMIEQVNWRSTKSRVSPSLSHLPHKSNIPLLHLPTTMLWGNMSVNHFPAYFLTFSFLLFLLYFSALFFLGFSVLDNWDFI